MSAGQLVHTKEYLQPRRSIPKEEVVEKNPIVESLSSSELARISSSMNLSMLNFMQSLNETNDEDDGAIFF